MSAKLTKKEKQAIESKKNYLAFMKKASLTLLEFANRYNIKVDNIVAMLEKSGGRYISIKFNINGIYYHLHGSSEDINNFVNNKNQILFDFMAISSLKQLVVTNQNIDYDLFICGYDGNMVCKSGIWGEL